MAQDNQKAPDSTTKYFFELTPERILLAVEALGFRCTGRCMALNSMENRVYEVEIEVDDQTLPPRAPQRFRVIKFYRPGRWTRQQIQDEHDFLFDLIKQDIPVVTPLKLANGQSINLVKDSEIFCAVFEKAGGRTPDELNVEQLERLGRLIARVHTVGSQRQAKSRLALNPISYGIDNLKLLIDSGTLPAEIIPHYKRVVELICSSCEARFRQVPIQRIHGDLHLANIVWRDDGPLLVDFDDMVRGPAVQDLWLVTGGNDEEGQRNREALIDGYEQMRSFDRATLDLIEPLRALRMIHYTAWIAKRWQDPAFPRAFPNFGSPGYWREALADLQEQLEIISGGGYER